MELQRYNGYVIVRLSSNEQFMSYDSDYCQERLGSAWPTLEVLANHIVHIGRHVVFRRIGRTVEVRSFATECPPNYEECDEEFHNLFEAIRTLSDDATVMQNITPLMFFSLIHNF